MKQETIVAGKRKSVNLLIDTGIVAAAKAAGVNLSRVTEAALRNAVRIEQERRWREENREWIAAQAAWVEQHGLPLDDLRVL